MIDWSIYDEWTFDSLHTLHFLSFASFGFCEKHVHTDCEYTDLSVAQNHVLRVIFFSFIINTHTVGARAEFYYIIHRF